MGGGPQPAGNTQIGPQVPGPEPGRPGAPTVSAAPASEIPAPDVSTGFGAYLFTHGAWYLAFGVQMVLFRYILRILLQENEVRFGLAQMCLQ